MRSGIRFILAALPAAAFLLIPLLSSAGSAPYNRKPQAARDMSYFCVAGDSHTFYITDVRHVDRPEYMGAPSPIGRAWFQAIHGQHDPLNAHCEFESTARIGGLRQSMLAQPHERTVNVQWQYGQSGPATASQ
ncbi:MAG: hypothetical protein ACREPP_11040 [Rhodanobacteraceae bacterium]